MVSMTTSPTTLVRKPTDVMGAVSDWDSPLYLTTGPFTDSAYRVIRKGVDVSLVTEQLGEDILSEDAQVQTIAKLIALDGGGYSIECGTIEEDLRLRRRPIHRYPNEAEAAAMREELKFWVVIRSIKEGTLPLKEGDTIKLGRLAFKIRQLVLDAEEEQKVVNVLAAGSNDDDDLATCETRRSEPSAAALVRRPSDVYTAGEQNLQIENENPPAPLSTSTQGHELYPLNDDPTPPPPSSNRQDESTAFFGSHDDEESVDGGPLCRVCLCEEEDPAKDPLISPCKCSGSMRWIHLACLRTWMEGRLNVKNEEADSCFFWRPLECELCQEPYPTFIDLKNNRGVSFDKISAPIVCDDPVTRALRCRAAVDAPDENIIELFRIPKPALPFLVLESNHHPSGCQGFHFISFQKQETVKLGRGHEADIRVADISVSRLHGAIRFQRDPEKLLTTLRESDFTQWGMSQSPSNEHEHLRTPLGASALAKDLKRPCVFVEDLRSKFGTLVATNHPVYLFPRMMLSLQIGRTVLTLYVRKPTWSRLIPNCFQIYYRGLVPRRLRRRRHNSATSDEISLGNHPADNRDVRLLETYLPMNSGQDAMFNAGPPEARRQADALAETQPLDRHADAF